MKYAKLKARMTFSVILALLIGAVSSILFLHIGFEENSQGEYYDPLTKVIDMPYTAEMFFIFFLPPALLCFMAMFIISAYFFKK